MNLALWFAVSAVGAQARQAEPEPREPGAGRPNIVLILADDLRRDALGSYGSKSAETPNIDALAERGVRFDDVYCMGSRHGAVCAPSRAMLLSGRYMARVPDNLKDVTTLPEVLRSVGYRTLFTGKWHNGKDALLRGFDAAGTVMLGGMSDHFAVPLVDLDPGSGELVPRESVPRHSTELFAEEAITLLESRPDREQPFFLFLSFTAPHDPRDAPPEFLQRFADDPPPLPADFLPQVPWDAERQWGGIRDEQLLPWPRPEGLLRAQIGEYYAMIAHLDHEVGRVLTALERSRLTENTVVVFTSDSGLALGSHGLLGKQSVFEHSMAVPLIIAGPGVAAGRRSGAFAYLLDLFATVCAIAEAPLPPQVDAISLRPALSGPFDGRGAILLAYRGSQRSIRVGHYKLIRFPEIDTTLLFDLARSPLETVDLSDDPASQGRIARLRILLEGTQMSCQDEQPWTVPEPRSPGADYTGNARSPDRSQPAWIRAKYFGD